MKCANIVNSIQCESEEIKDIGLLCVWGKDNFKDFGCVVENSLKCDDYLTLSGCTWSDVTNNNLKMICEWSNEMMKCSNSTKCENLKKTSLLCENYTSDNGKCFFNGENEITLLEKSCSGILDVNDCQFFKSVSVCTGANKEIYLNLPGVLEFPCVWDMKKTQCELNNSQNIPQIEDDGESDPTQSGSFVLIIIIIVVVVMVVLIVVIVIVIIILYRRKMNRNLKNITDFSNMRELEMESLKASRPSLSTGQRTQRKLSLCCLRYIFYFS
jgi:hypothetical protein